MSKCNRATGPDNKASALPMKRKDHRQPRRANRDCLARASFLFRGHRLDAAGWEARTGFARRLHQRGLLCQRARIRIGDHLWHRTTCPHGDRADVFGLGRGSMGLECTADLLESRPVWPWLRDWARQCTRRRANHGRPPLGMSWQIGEPGAVKESPPDVPPTTSRMPPPG